ncbi:unnamed protein product, partial [Cladocopium goreaui]
MFGSHPYVLSLSSWSKPKVLSHRFQNPNFKNLHLSVVFLSSCFLPRWCTHVKLDQVPVDQGRWCVCVCGNYQDSNGDERYAGGADGNQIRAQVRIAALKGWTVNGTDIRVAFLNAPKRDETRITAMEAPTVFKKLGLAGQVFSDIGFGTGSSERSMQGMAIFFGGLVISWQTTVQPFVTHSTAESELVGCDALSAGSGELFLLSVMQGPAAASPQVSAWQQYLRRVTVYAFVALGVLSAQLVTDDQACKIPEDEWLRMYHLIIKNTVRIIVNVLAEAGNEASVRIKRGKGSSSSNPSSTSLSIKIRSGTGIQHRDENSPEASSRGSSERVAAVPPRNIVYDIGLCKCCWSELELGSRADLTQGVAVIAWQLRPSWGES